MYILICIREWRIEIHDETNVMCYQIKDVCGLGEIKKYSHLINSLCNGIFCITVSFKHMQMESSCVYVTVVCLVQPRHPVS